MLVARDGKRLDLLEYVERGLRRFPVLDLSAVHRALLVHCHVEDRVGLCVAAAGAYKTLMHVQPVSIPINRCCILLRIADVILTVRSFARTWTHEALVLLNLIHVHVVRIHSRSILGACRIEREQKIAIVTADMDDLT